MLPSLNIDCQWFDQPAASDPVERKTWADVRIQAAGRSVTRLLNRAIEAEREGIEIPAFPIASWLVSNWWSLLHQPSPFDTIPQAGQAWQPQHQEWVRGHCLRAAGAGLLLPRAFLYSDGRELCVTWSADDPDAYPHMPGSFVDSGHVVVSRQGTESALCDFVTSVLSRVSTMDDPRASTLRANWDAITEADVSEAAFCRAAGRMGLNPYEWESWDDSLVTLLETGIGDDPDIPMVEDFLEAAEAASAPRVWKWVESTRTTLDLTEAPGRIQPLTQESASAAASGYDLAGKVRVQLGAGQGEAISDLPEVGRTLGMRSFDFVEHNHLPSANVRAAVGWQRGGAAVIAGPKPRDENLRRFLHARGLYCAAFGCAKGPRLITTAHTWDQQAARAFAAELLAPRAALVAEYRSRKNTEKADTFVRRMARKFRVSTRVIDYNLENAYLSIDPE